MELTTDNSIVYTLTVTVARPLRVYDDAYTLQETTDWMMGAQAKRELEREVLKALRTLDGDCDAETIGLTIVQGER